MELSRIERDRDEIREEVEQLKAEHRTRYAALQMLASQHRRLSRQDKKPTNKALKTMINAACRQVENGLRTEDIEDYADSERSHLLP